MDICPNIFANDTTGTVNPSSSEFDPFFTYTFQCIANYLLVAINAVSANYFCEASGAWNTTFTPCSGRQTLLTNNWLYFLLRLATCDPIASLTNGTVTGATSTNTLNRPIAGSIAIYTCDPGFALIGSNTSTCSSNGTWSTPAPSCSCKFIFNYCQAIDYIITLLFKIVDICPNIFGNDTTGTVNPSSPFDPFMTYTFQCIANYLLTAINAVSASYFCEASGAWNTTFTPCTGSKQIILDQTTLNLS